MARDFFISSNCSLGGTVGLIGRDPFLRRGAVSGPFTDKLSSGLGCGPVCERAWEEGLGGTGPSGTGWDSGGRTESDSGGGATLARV